MSSRRAPPKARGQVAARNAMSNLERVVRIGFSNMSINKKAVGVDIQPASTPDIGTMNWVRFDVGEEDTKVIEFSTKISRLIVLLPNVTGNRDRIHELYQRITAMGNAGGSAAPGKVSRGYYVYLLQVFEQVLNTVIMEGSGDARFRSSWPSVVRSIDADTAQVAANALFDPNTPESAKAVIYDYYSHVDRRIFNFFTNPNVEANSASPKLTKVLQDYTVVLNASLTLLGYSSSGTDTPE